MLAHVLYVPIQIPLHVVLEILQFGGSFETAASTTRLE